MRPLKKRTQLKADAPLKNQSQISNIFGLSARTPSTFGVDTVVKHHDECTTKAINNMSPEFPESENKYNVSVRGEGEVTKYDIVI